MEFLNILKPEWIEEALLGSPAKLQLQTPVLKWEATLDAITEAVSVLSIDRRILQCNKAMVNLVGKPFSEITGRSCCELMHGTTVPIEGCPVVRMQQTRCHEKNVFSIKDRWFNVNAEPLFDESGNLFGAVHVIADITQFKQAEERLRSAKEQLNFLLSSTPAVIYSYKLSGDLDFSAIFVSENVIAQLGYDSREFIEDSSFWANHIHPEDRERSFTALNQLFECGHIALEYRFLHKDGKYRWIHDESKLVRDGSGTPVDLVGYWIDVTERKRAEEELTVKHEELQRAYDELKEFGERRSDFVNMAAHELRTPLTPIVGYLELLKNRVTDKEALGFVEVMERNAMRFKKLIDDMLVLSRLDAGKLELRVSTVYVNGVIQWLLDNYALCRHRFIVDIPGDLLIQCDESKLFQILDNLISNAVRYSESDTQVKIVAVEREEDYLFKIIDQGAGIAEKDQKRIFERFYIVSGEKLNRSVRRTGLGLALAKSYVELHGGQIWVESKVGKGSTFYFTIPKEIKSL